MLLTDLLSEFDAEEAIPDDFEDKADEAAEKDVGSENLTLPAPLNLSDLLKLTDKDGNSLEVGDTFTELQVENISDQETDAGQFFFPACGGNIFDCHSPVDTRSR